MMVLRIPRKSSDPDKEFYPQLTEQDRDILLWRFERHHGGDINLAGFIIGNGFAGDEIDTMYMDRAVRCVDSCRSVALRASDWLIEEQERRIKECDTGHISKLFEE